jgi:serine kinase of HPr protein (carbohydrate metabolism regulator)
LIAHAGLVARRERGVWRGALIEGPSGSGKSDLTLRLLDEAGFRLVADDRVRLWVCDGRLFGRAPETLDGLAEARGLGILRIEALPLAEVVLTVRPGAPERLPEATSIDLLGVRLPRLELSYLEASAPAKLRRALGALYLGGQRRM